MHALSRLLEPPRLRTLDDEDERRATWLELFFDLVFVAAVGQLATALAADPTPARFLVFLALFVPVWWAWMGFTFYANRFDTDDLPYRLLVLLGMFCVAALATTIHPAFDGVTTGFVLAYVSVRVVLLVLYERARRHVERARRLATTFLLAFGAGVLAWLASLLLPAPWRYALWAVALAFELSAPLFAWRTLPNAPINRRHIPERFGLLTIIVLGESVLAVVVGVSKVHWDARSASAASLAFVLGAALWWIYFEFVDEEAAVGGILSGLAYTYAHFPIVAGLAALGAGVKLAILGHESAAWILCAGLALTMGGLAVIELVTRPTVLDTDLWLRFGTAALALVLIPFSIPPVAVLVVLVGALVLQVAFELVEHPEHGPGASTI